MDTQNGKHIDDCTKRAITLAFGLPYRQVQLGLNRHKKITGADNFYSKHNPHSYVENVLGAKKITPKNKTTAEEFSKEHPSGRPRLANCCTAERISDTLTVIRIYDGNGSSVERWIEPRLTEGYIRCLEDSNYIFVKL